MSSVMSKTTKQAGTIMATIIVLPLGLCVTSEGLVISIQLRCSYR